MTVQRLSEKFSGWIETALLEHDQGDEMAWEFGVAPTVNGLVPALLIQMPSPVLGETMGLQIIFGKGMLTTEEEIKKHIGEGLEGVRAERTRMLTELSQMKPT